MTALVAAAARVLAPLIGLVLPSPENHSSMLGRSYVTPLAETTGSLMMSFEIGQPEPFNHYGDAPQTPSWQHASYYLRTMHSHHLVTKSPWRIGHPSMASPHVTLPSPSGSPDAVSRSRKPQLDARPVVGNAGGGGLGPHAHGDKQLFAYIRRV